MKKILSLLSMSVLAFPALSQAQFTVFTGEDLFKAFGNRTGELDSTTWSPNSAVQQSLKINFDVGFGTYAFRGVSATQSIAPASIDWSAGDLTFDYMTTSVTSMFVAARLFILSGATDTQVLAGGNSIALTADGAWHTATIPVSDWTAAYYTAVGNATFDPNAPQQYRIFFQNASATGFINIDNVQLPTAVPEPATLAAILGILALGFVICRRRK